jgi:hypothetical protein
MIARIIPYELAPCSTCGEYNNVFRLGGNIDNPSRARAVDLVKGGDVVMDSHLHVSASEPWHRA